MPPPTAVEILDVTKNIFDINNCIFVLAIDYEVIVKGLESKFGKRTKENEREFRQYFDKIIQIPFTMPIGAFSRKINLMLENALTSLNYSLPPERRYLVLERLAKALKLSTGGIPRSIKRILNTFSLLDYIAAENSANDGKRENELEARFIIVALHINFPEICKRLMERPDFTGWDKHELDILWNLDIKNHEKQINALNESRIAKYFDESWEQVVYCLCSQTEWLKANVVNVVRLLNLLRNVLNHTDDADADNPEKLDNSAQETIARLIGSIRIISIDSDLQNIAVGNSQAQGQVFSCFAQAIWSACASEIGVKSESAFKINAIFTEENLWSWTNKLDGKIESFRFLLDPEIDHLMFVWTAKRRNLSQKEADSIIREITRDKKVFISFAGNIENATFSLSFDVLNFNDSSDFKDALFRNETKIAVLQGYGLIKKCLERLG